MPIANPLLECRNFNFCSLFSHKSLKIFLESYCREIVGYGDYLSHTNEYNNLYLYLFTWSFSLV